MKKKKTKTKKSKKQQAGELAQIAAFLGQGSKRFFGGLAPVYGTGKRATIIGEAPSHGKPMKYAQLTGGKRLVMSGADKGKII